MLRQKFNCATPPPRPPGLRKWRRFRPDRALPNETSPHKTPATVIYDQHWVSLDLIRRWNWERYVRLCQFLSHTPYELASLIGLPHKNVDIIKKHDRIVLGAGDAASQAIALILTLLEANVLRDIHTDAMANPFPQLKQ